MDPNTLQVSPESIEVQRPSHPGVQQLRDLAMALFPDNVEEGIRMLVEILGGQEQQIEGINPDLPPAQQVSPESIEVGSPRRWLEQGIGALSNPMTAKTPYQRYLDSSAAENAPITEPIPGPAPMPFDQVQPAEDFEGMDYAPLPAYKPLQRPVTPSRPAPKRSPAPAPAEQMGPPASMKQFPYSPGASGNFGRDEYSAMRAAQPLNTAQVASKAPSGREVYGGGSIATPGSYQDQLAQGSAKQELERDKLKAKQKQKQQPQINPGPYASFMDTFGMPRR